MRLRKSNGFLINKNPVKTRLSPLLFNLCYNTFIQFIKQEKYVQLGFSPHDASDRLFHPIHWFRFADDDAAVVASDEREN